MGTGTRTLRGRVLAVLAVLAIAAPGVPCSAFAQAQAQPQLHVNFVYGGRTYRLPQDQRVLQVVYGPNWQESFAWRTYRIASEDEATRAQLQRLQAIRGNDVTVNVRYDDPDRVFPGERIFLSDQCGWETIQPGESLEGMVRRRFYGGRTADQLTPAEQSKVPWAVGVIAANNPGRFDVYPHATPGDSTIDLPHEVADRPELAAYGTDRGLAGMLAHEVAHTADRTTPDTDSYGGDGRHALNEITSPRMAFMEGWASYNQALASPDRVSQVLLAASNLRREQDGSTERSPRYAMLLGASYEDLVACEGVVAGLWLAIDDGGRNREALCRSFAATSTATSSVEATLAHYVAGASPDEGLRAVRLFDLLTEFTAEPAAFARYGASGQAYLAEREALKQRWARCRHHGCTLERFLQGLRDPEGMPLDAWDKPIPEGEEDFGEIVVVRPSSAGAGGRPTVPVELLGQPPGDGR